MMKSQEVNQVKTLKWSYVDNTGVKKVEDFNLKCKCFYDCGDYVAFICQNGKEKVKVVKNHNGIRYFSFCNMILRLE